ncbi:MAG TPA: hypothetical protein VFY79_07435 [Dehalococcoidia bacterium]|nr:hypothetical protein [Dehalococcoidia bacterium]
MPRLESVNLKLERAREHRKAIDREISVFRASQLYPVRADIDSQTGEQIWRLDCEPEAPPRRIAQMVGDCLCNFRAALDHLAWELCSVPDRRTMFPIYDDPAKFSNSFSRLHDIGVEALALLVMTQPCFGLNHYRNSMLCALESLVNVDKHRYLHIISAGTLGAFWEPGSPTGAGPVVHEGPIHDKTVLARFTPDDVKTYFAPAISVAFAEGTLRSGGEIVQTLMGIDFTTCFTVDAFRSQFFPDAERFPAPDS